MRPPPRREQEVVGRLAPPRLFGLLHTPAPSERKATRRDTPPVLGPLARLVLREV